MKNLMMAAALTVLAAGSALAADSVVLKAKNGDVVFDHKKHVEKAPACTACHESDKGGKIAALGKEWAHKTCKGCHEEKKAGPTRCGDCHKK